jgi:hypothetical protein
VAGETVTGIPAIVVGHQPVAHHLGDHRSGGDGEGAAVAFFQGLLGQRQGTGVMPSTSR